ncbi:AraC-like DNA-binding protein [Altererythrobacter atlanticus]|uniref:Transcriptional activator NphR n=1 Tax=Croceibacterium atlanticum TaxID=1267766 RepID=A0A0F7KPX1_9SPHN|nr:helix-turn-helix domain-containing protein [Croceibacterium atlanticum]AKH42583.1 Transcriptional activator NphR [Croceibacterium atlanticum]MBB5731360.1 AraC-like DNA-binding protein [Croceibacterium atlanticum]
MSSIAKFVTDGVAADDRLRYWNSVADEVFCGTFVNAESQRFEGELWSWSVGDLDMIRTRSVTASVGRRPLDTVEERVIMHMQWRGTGQHRQRGQETQLGPGDFVIGSPHSPYQFDLSPHEMMVVEFPKQGLLERVPDLEDRLAKSLSGNSAAARVFNDFLMSLWRQADGTDPLDGNWTEGVNRVFYDLAAMAIRDAGRENPVSEQEIRLRRHAEAVIDAALDDPDLRSATIASELGTSVRSVQNLFAKAGTTPSAAILNRRLERAAERLITDPKATITDIAFAHGFNDSAYFTRCFRQKFGISPRDWRMGNSD